MPVEILRNFPGITIAHSLVERSHHMNTPLLILLAAVIVLGLFYAVLPFALDVYVRFRHQKVVTCPDTRGLAEVKLNARWAAFTAIFRKPVLHVKSCTLWPKKKGCAEGCVRENWPPE
jgi:hypothetical protein